MTTYTIIKNTSGDILSIRRGDGASIPVCDGNADYQQYLIDTAAGVVPSEEVIPDPVPSISSEERLAALEQYVMDKELGLI